MTSLDALLLRVTLDPDAPVTPEEQALLDGDLRVAVGLPEHGPVVAVRVAPPDAVGAYVTAVPQADGDGFVHDLSLRPAFPRPSQSVRSWAHDVDRPEVVAAVEQARGGDREALLALMRTLTG